MSAITIDKTIKTAMENIESHHFVLPAIQRKFVWSPERPKISLELYSARW